MSIHYKKIFFVICGVLVSGLFAHSANAFSGTGYCGAEDVGGVNELVSE